ncbi:MAG: prephenate dehydrogenase/arogenate dehydrogenase family protein [Deltaproteobacteria bacterium]|nr:prephenate dehydrogenase/arogenate dehydrogenase family protein [Deltaproteobacteria bacterium]
MAFVKNSSIGIIGFGRFGRLMARYLSSDCQVLAHDPGVRPEAMASVGAVPAAIEGVCRSDIVILAVPISHLQGLLSAIRPHLQQESLVIDVCSVKEQPVRWMQELLPETVDILGTHPMFGPDSAADSLDGRKVVLCPVRIGDRRFEKVKHYLGAKGLVLIETSAEDHDRQIAVSLALTHTIGRSLAQFGAQPQVIDTEGYKRLLRILEVVENDTWQLFEDMNRYNPYARNARQAFIAAMNAIDGRLRG